MPRNNGTPVSHDQNFKNLILDYPRQAIDLFCEQEARELDDSVRIVPLRQEQLKERLGEHFFSFNTFAARYRSWKRKITGTATT